MTFNDLLAVKGMTVNSLSRISGVAKTTVFDIASGKTDLLECAGKTLRALSKPLKVSIEELLDLEKDRTNEYPEILIFSITKLRESLREKSNIKEIYLKQFYSCLDSVVNQNLITEEEAKMLKERYKFVTGGN